MTEWTMAEASCAGCAFVVAAENSILIGKPVQYRLHMEVIQAVASMRARKQV